MSSSSGLTSKQLAFRGVLFNWTARICSMLVALLVTPFLVTRLGNEFYGLWSLVMSVTNYYSLADLGLRGTTVKFLAEFRALDDKRSVACVLRTLRLVYLGLGVLVIGLSLFVAWFFPALIDLDQANASSVRWVIVLLGCNVATQLSGNVFGAALDSMKRFDLSNIVGITANLAQSGLVVLAISLGTGIVGMAAAVLTVGIATQLTQRYLASRLLGNTGMNQGVVNRATLSQLFGFSSMNVIVNATRRLVQYGGSLLVGIFLGPAVVTYYALAEGLVRQVANIGKGVSTVVMPISSELQAQGRKRELAQVLVQVPRVLLGIGLCFGVIFFVLGDRIIECWIGPGYGQVVFPILRVLSVLLLVDLTSGGLHQLLAGIGRMRFLASVALIEGLLILGLGIPLILTMGVVGMAWGMVLGRVFTTGILLPYTACCEVGYSYSRFVLRALLTPILGAIPSIVIGFAMRELVRGTGLFSLSLQLGATAAAGAAGIFFTGFDRSMRADLVRAILPQRIISLRRDSA
jgi:O-antigen/teichoic acid export membrane protein